MEIGAGLNMRRLRLVRLTAGLALFAWMLNPGSLPSAPQNKRDSFDKLTERAKKASEENRLEEATSLYRKALALRPRWAEGWWSLGTLQYDQNQYADAARAFEKLIVLQRENGTAHAMLGLCQFEMGKDETALKNLLAAERLRVLKDEQLRNVARYHLGVLQLRARRFGDANETLGQLAKEGVRTRELTNALGLAALLVKPQEAPPEGTAGASVIERAGEAEALVAAKNFEQAKLRYAQLASEFPDYPNLHFAYGRMLLAAMEPDEAVVEFLRELARDPQNVNSLLEIAAVRYKLDSADGVKYAEQAVNQAPKRPFGHYLLGLLYLDAQNFNGAISELEIARSSLTTVPEVYMALGNAYARAGKKAEAARARADFMRLSAKRNQEPDVSDYDEHPRGLTQEKLGARPEKNPPN